MKKKLFFILTLSIVLITSLIVPVRAADLEPPTVYSPSALLMDSTTGKIIYEKNSNEKRYPASTTKIMTAILTLENTKLTDKTTVSYNAVMTVPVGYAHANLQIGEELTIEQLLHVLLIHSANDAANVLAEEVAGSIDSFASMMNTKASELGCQNTHFTNPSGIHDENHYSTASDLALIGKYAMKNETFRGIVAKTSYTLPATEKYSNTDRVFKTTNELMVQDNSTRPTNYSYQYATGIKTGYTTPAKNCIVASAKRDDLEFICVILGATQTETGLSQRYIDAKTLFEFGFNNYTLKKIKEKDSVLKQIIISNGTRDTKNLDLVLENEITVLIKQQDLDKTLLPDIKLNEKLKAPIEKGTQVGTLSYTIEDITYTTNLLAGDNVEKTSTFATILKILFVLFVLWLFVKYLKVKNKKLKRKRSKKAKNYRIY